MYSFLSRTSLIVKETISRPILSMSSAEVARMRSATISGCLTISSTASWPTIPRRWPSMTSRISPSALRLNLGEQLLGGGADRVRDRF